LNTFYYFEQKKRRSKVVNKKSYGATSGRLRERLTKGGFPESMNWFIKLILILMMMI
jgi:hypothetical protein